MTTMTIRQPTKPAPRPATNPQQPRDAVPNHSVTRLESVSETPSAN